MPRWVQAIEAMLDGIEQAESDIKAYADSNRITNIFDAYSPEALFSSGYILDRYVPERPDETISPNTVYRNTDQAPIMVHGIGRVDGVGGELSLNVGINNWDLVPHQQSTPETEIFSAACLIPNKYFYEFSEDDGFGGSTEWLQLYRQPIHAETPVDIKPISDLSNTIGQSFALLEFSGDILLFDIDSESSSSFSINIADDLSPGEDAIAWSPNANKLASVANGGESIRIYNPTDWTTAPETGEVGTLLKSSNPVPYEALEFTADESQIIYPDGSNSDVLKRADATVSTGRTISTIDTLSNTISAIDLSTERSQIAVATEGDDVHIYNTADWTQTQKLTSSDTDAVNWDSHVNSVEYNWDGTLLAFGTEDRYRVLYEFEGGSWSWTSAGPVGDPDDEAETVAYSPSSSNKYLAVGTEGPGNQIEVDKTAGTAAVIDLPAAPRVVDFSKDGEILGVAMAGDTDTEFYETNTWNKVETVSGKNVHNIAFAPEDI